MSSGCMFCQGSGYRRCDCPEVTGRLDLLRISTLYARSSEAAASYVPALVKENRSLRAELAAAAPVTRAPQGDDLTARALEDDEAFPGFGGGVGAGSEIRRLRAVEAAARQLLKVQDSGTGREVSAAQKALRAALEQKS